MRVATHRDVPANESPTSPRKPSKVMDASLLVDVKVFAGSQNFTLCVEQGYLVVVRHGEHDQVKGVPWNLSSKNCIDTKIDFASVYSRPGDNIILTTESVLVFAHLSPQRSRERTKEQAELVWEEIQPHLDETYIQSQEEVASQGVRLCHIEPSIDQTRELNLESQENNPTMKIDDDESSYYEVLPNLMEEIHMPPPEHGITPTKVNKAPVGTRTAHHEVNIPLIEVAVPPLKRRGRPPKKRKREKKDSTYGPNKRQATDRDVTFRQTRLSTEPQAMCTYQAKKHRLEPNGASKTDSQEAGAAICWVFYPSNDPFRHAQGDAGLLPVEQRLEIYRDIIGVGLKKSFFAKKFYQEADYRLERNSEGNLVSNVEVRDRQNIFRAKLPEGFFPDQKRTNPVITTERTYVTCEYCLGEDVTPNVEINTLYDVYLYDEQKSQLIKSQFG